MQQTHLQPRRGRAAREVTEVRRSTAERDNENQTAALEPWMPWNLRVGMAAYTRKASTTARKPADMFFRLG